MQVRWADLTSAADVEALLAAVSPTAIIHLAAIIPPFCYARPGLARAVNVDATASLVKAASALPIPPRFVQASSVAVYGARNPHRNDGLLTSSTPLRPNDLYGAHKVMAEQHVTASELDWVVLRLGGVLLAEPRWALDRDLIFFEAVLPSDGRIQTVDVRDVAHAFCAATVTERVCEIFLIGGDETHRITQAGLGTESAAAMGLVGGLPTGRPGDPDDDQAWFATDWMDTELRAESPCLPTPFAARNVRRDPGEGGLAPLAVAAARSRAALVSEATIALSRISGCVCGSLGSDRQTLGRPSGAPVSGCGYTGGSGIGGTSRRVARVPDVDRRRRDERRASLELRSVGAVNPSGRNPLMNAPSNV